MFTALLFEAKYILKSWKWMILAIVLVGAIFFFSLTLGVATHSLEITAMLTLLAGSLGLFIFTLFSRRSRSAELLARDGLDQMYGLLPFSRTQLGVLRVIRRLLLLAGMVLGGYFCHASIRYYGLVAFVAFVFAAAEIVFDLWEVRARSKRMRAFIFITIFVAINFVFNNKFSYALIGNQKARFVLIAVLAIAAYLGSFYTYNLRKQILVR